MLTTLPNLSCLVEALIQIKIQESIIRLKITRNLYVACPLINVYSPPLQITPQRRATIIMMHESDICIHEHYVG